MIVNISTKDQRVDAWHKLVDIIESYLEQNQDPNTPVVKYRSATDLKEELGLKISESGADSSEVFEEITKYLEYSVRTTHPQFNNQLNAGFNFNALMGEIVSFIANTSMATFEIAPVATLIETKLVEELNKSIGYEDGHGIMVTGGSNANLMAIHCARTRMFPDAKHSGNPAKDLCIFVSKEAHYSFQKAVSLLGLGLNNLIKVDSTDQGEMDSNDLENKINKCIEEGKTPLLIASTAGTTVMGAFDPVSKNQEIAKKYNLWHHIDGAWGGAALFSDKLRQRLSGCEESDSFTFDAHKLLGTGLITSFFLTKDKDIIKETNSGGGGSYLFHEYENSEYDTGAFSLQCGRKVDSLKFWLTWKALGHKGLQEFVDAQVSKREHLVNLINEHPRLKMLHDPQFLNVCFQVLPTEENVDINKYNFDLRFKLVKEGKYLVNFSSWEDGTVFFRHVFANNVTQKQDLEKVIEEIVALSETM